MAESEKKMMMTRLQESKERKEQEEQSEKPRKGSTIEELKERFREVKTPTKEEGNLVEENYDEFLASYDNSEREDNQELWKEAIKAIVLEQLKENRNIELEQALKEVDTLQKLQADAQDSSLTRPQQSNALKAAIKMENLQDAISSAEIEDSNRLDPSRPQQSSRAQKAVDKMDKIQGANGLVAVDNPTNQKQQNRSEVHFLAQANITLKSPECFTGIASSPITIRQFLRDYELYIKTAFDGDESRAKQFLLPNLKNMAADWYYGHVYPIEKDLSWKEIKEKFMDRFSNTHGEQAILEKIYNICQTKSQSVAQYSELLHSLMSNTNLDEPSKVLFYVKGLKTGVKRLVTRQKPKTFQSAIEMATTAEVTISACTEGDDKVSEVLEILKRREINSISTPSQKPRQDEYTPYFNPAQNLKGQLPEVEMCYVNSSPSGTSYYPVNSYRGGTGSTNNFVPRGQNRFTNSYRGNYQPNSYQSGNYQGQTRYQGNRYQGNRYQGTNRFPSNQGTGRYPSNYQRGNFRGRGSFTPRPSFNAQSQNNAPRYNNNNYENRNNNSYGSGFSRPNSNGRGLVQNARYTRRPNYRGNNE